MTKKRLFTAATLTLCLSVIGLNVLAHEAASGIVKQRMINMKAMGNAMKGITVMMRKNTHYDPGLARVHAQTIQRLAGHALTDLFPKGSLQEPTEAVPEIWTQWQNFKALGEQLVGDAKSLEATVNKDFKTRNRALANMGKTCSACHKTYRRKK